MRMGRIRMRRNGEGMEKEWRMEERKRKL